MTQLTQLDVGAAEQRPRAPLWAAKLYYLSFFAAIGALAPFFNLFLRAQGLSGAEIGLLGSIPPLIALAANPFWGGLADRWHWHQRVLAFCAFIAGLLSIFFIFANNFAPLLLLLVLMVFFRTPVPSLLDTAVLGMVARNGASYGRQRLFGSIGFLTVSLGLGQLVTSANLSAIFWVHGLLFMCACAPLSLLLPFERTSERSDLLQGLRKLARQGAYMSFLVMNVVMGLGTACYVNFIGLRILELGGTEAMVGLGFALNAVTEIPIMFVGARLMARFNHSQLILAGLLGFAGAYLLMALAQTPQMILLVMPTMGLFYGGFWMAVVAYANETAPPGLRATGQALVGAAQGGLGWALGSIIGGLLWDSAGGMMVLMMASFSMVLGAVIFAAGQRTGARHATGGAG